MKRFAALLALSLGFAWPLEAQQVQSDNMSESFGSPVISRPKIRMWLPLTSLDEAELRREVFEIARAGFSGIEVIGVPVGGDLSRHGFATPAWTSAMEALGSEARLRRLSLDYTATASYPPAVPMKDVEAYVASQEIVYGFVEFAETFDGILPEPLETASLGVTKRRLVAVSAAQLVNGSSITAKRGVLDVATLIDLTEQVQDDRLSWRAPASGRWVIVASWQRATGHAVESTSPHSVVIDHFSGGGAEALIRQWERILPPRLAGTTLPSDVFEDSLHLKGFALWTHEFEPEFQRRRGYSLRKFLPAVYIPHLNDFFHGSGRDGLRPVDLTVATPADFELSDGSGKRIREDYYQTLTELYAEKHLAPLRNWLNRRGYRYRVQPSYGQSLEGTIPTTLVDVPETESFQLDDLLDGYRVQAAAVHVSGKPVYSAECCAVRDAAYGFGWLETIEHIAGTFAGGVNQIVLHGYGYRDGPGAFWPGWTSFGHLFSENYPRLPIWSHASDFTGYLGRQQFVLRQGTPKVDLAIYRLSYWDNGRGKRGKLETYYDDPRLGEAGYTYEYLSPGLIDRPNVTVADGVLAADGPGYRAILLSDVEAIPVTALEKIITYARDGLPVIAIGSLPGRATGYDRAADVKVAELIERLSASPRFFKISDQKDVPALLKRLAIRPSAQPTGPTSLRTVRRQAAGVDYYLLLNPARAAVRQQFHLLGKGSPVVMDAWTGSVTPLATFTRDDDGVSAVFDLAPGGSMLIAIGTAGWIRSQEHFLVSAHPSVRTMVAGGKVLASAECDGIYRFTFNDGRIVERKLMGPRSVKLQRWSLELNEWLPGKRIHEVRVVRHTRRLGQPQPWSSFPDLANASGLGTYRASFYLPPATSAATELILRVAEVGDTFRVRVNGRALPPVDQVRREVDIRPWAKAGRNAIEIEVASTLRNRMRQLYKEQEGRAAERNGLGPGLSLKLYSIAEINR